MLERTRSESGQAFVLMLVALVALLGTAALVMDVGFAWYAKRQVQASADAAALAGAQQLPDIASATATATQYAALNTPDNLSNVNVNVTTRCSTNASAWCNQAAGNTFQANTIAVTETANTPAWFANVLGFDHFDVKGVATACQPCSSAPVDIMLVVDRTGSMCQPTGPGGVCTDLDNAKDGVQTLLGIMDPNIDTVGLVAFPPYNDNTSNAVCSNHAASSSFTINGVSISPANYDQQNLVYLNDPLGDDFKTTATSPLNPASSLVQHMTDDTSGVHNCIQSFGSTSYDQALVAAKAELDKDGRPGVPKVIVFMTDGEANIGGYWPGVAGHGYEPDLGDPATNFNMSPVGSGSIINPDDAQPCHTAINEATAIKSDGVTMYTIGYALQDGTTGAYAYCTHGVWGEIDRSWASSSTDYQNFRCVTIGTTLTGPNKNKSWANGGSGHYQGQDPAPAPSSSNQNPCTNSISGDHGEEPQITSYETLQSIASPGDFYNKPSAGDVTQIFAAIAADITKGTSRLVDDSY